MRLRMALFEASVRRGLDLPRETDESAAIASLAVSRCSRASTRRPEATLVTGPRAWTDGLRRVWGVGPELLLCQAPLFGGRPVPPDE